MLTLTGKVQHVFSVPARKNLQTGEEIPASSKVQIMGHVPVRGGEHKYELFDFKTDRPTAFHAAINKIVRVPVQVYQVEGAAGLFMPKGVEIELLNEKGERTGLLDSDGPTPNPPSPKGVVAVRASRVLLIPLLLLAAPARADTGAFVCTQVDAVTNNCTAWQSVSDGVATFETLGITSDAILEVFAWGFGTVIGFFAFGLGMGAVIQAVKTLGD